MNESPNVAEVMLLERIRDAINVGHPPGRRNGFILAIFPFDHLFESIEAPTGERQVVIFGDLAVRIADLDITRRPWTCAAHAFVRSDPPSDCGWPECSCDPNVERVVAGLRESGWTVEPPVYCTFPKVTP